MKTICSMQDILVGDRIAGCSHQLRFEGRRACRDVYTFVIGDGVPHFHMHVVPRYPGAPREYWGVHVDEWPGAPRGGPPEIVALCARLHLYLESEDRWSQADKTT